MLRLAPARGGHGSVKDDAVSIDLERRGFLAGSGVHFLDPGVVGFGLVFCRIR
jgi:hypothetical protein